MKNFNATEELINFSPTMYRPVQHPKNYLREGMIIHAFEETDLSERIYGGVYPMIKSDEGILYNSPWVASLLIDGPNLIQNLDRDPKFHCILPPRLAKEEGLEFSYLQEHLTDRGTFPRFKVNTVLPVAVEREDIIQHASPETIAIYKQVFGVCLTKLDMKYIPHHRKSAYDRCTSLSRLTATVEILA